MKVTARELKVGNKVNCHEDGWLTVSKIQPTFALNIVTFKQKGYSVIKYFNLDEEVEIQ